MTSLQLQSVAAGILGVALAFPVTFVLAQEAYPSKPVRLVVPFPPAGPNDMTARIYAQKLSENWGGKPVIVENRGGATGSIGTNAVAKAAPDGYTLLFTVDLPIVMAPALFKTPYDPRKDLLPVVTLTDIMQILLVHPSAGIKTTTQLVAKAKQGALTFSSGGDGSPGHLCMEMIKSATGINLTHVPYKGAAPAFAAVLAGEVSLFCSPIPQGLASIKAGRIYALGTTGANPSPLTPDVAPLLRTWPEVVFSNWTAVFAPPNTPAAIIAFLTAELRKVYNDKTVQQRLVAAGIDPNWADSAATSAIIDRDLAKWGRIVKEAGVKSE